MTLFARLQLPHEITLRDRVCITSRREDDGEASDAQALKEQIDVAWHGLNNFSDHLTYIIISQDVTHAYFKKGWNKGCKTARILTKVSVVSSILQQADAIALKGFFRIPCGGFIHDMWHLKNGSTHEWNTADKCPQ